MYLSVHILRVWTLCLVDISCGSTVYSGQITPPFRASPHSSTLLSHPYTELGEAQDLKRDYWNLQLLIDEIASCMKTEESWCGNGRVTQCMVSVLSCGFPDTLPSMVEKMCLWRRSVSSGCREEYIIYNIRLINYFRISNCEFHLQITGPETFS